MVFLCRYLVLMLMVMLSFDQRAWSAAGPAENRAFRAATEGFQDGLWSWADSAFGGFVLTFPESERVPEVILYQAEARYQMGRYAEAIELLAANTNKAEHWADQYQYWIAQSHLQIGNNTVAADSFSALAAQFPESTRLLDTAVGEAIARARLGQTERVVSLLLNPEGPFQKSLPRASATNELIGHGYLLLGESQLALKDYPAVDATLERLAPLPLKGALEWRRSFLESRAYFGAGRLEAAAASAEKLTTASEGLGDPAKSAETAALQGTILEKLGRLDAAVAAYQRNLSTNFPVPVEYQRFALLKSTELNLAQEKTADAVRTLERYLNQQPESEASDAALLGLGELELKQYLKAAGTNRGANPVETNLLAQALARFDRLLANHTNSPLTGKALLNKGWCYWEGADFTQSGEMFALAAEALPYSEDQAIARFKQADSLFRLKDFSGAITNYRRLVAEYAAAPFVKPYLEQALYQNVRAALAATNMDAGREAMSRILEWYPNSFAGQSSLLLLGEGLVAQRNPAGARQIFSEFNERFPASPLLPQVRLAVARSFEEEGQWMAAVTNYDAWIGAFTNQHADLPYAMFCSAQANYKAGRETNALHLFHELVTRYPTNDLAVWAQFAVGDHYFRNGDYPEANRNYQLVFQNTNALPELTYQARMMAGRSAVAHANYIGAIVHFTNLTANPRCPASLRAQATIAYGDAVMNRDPENRAANLQEAVTIFRTIPATNDLAAVAQGRIGDCWLQLAATDPQWYASASNAYQQVLTMPSATPSVRFQAKLGLASMAESQARLKSGEEQAALYQLALNYCYDVIEPKELRDGDPDPFSLKEAGIRAGRCAKALNQWEQALKLYTRLQARLPSMRTTWENEIINVQRNLK